MGAFLKRVAMAALAAPLAFAACGSPIAPPPPPPPPPVNNPPVINSISIQGRRANEPANFADLSETVSVTADVRDDETPVSQLQFNWSAPVGTFTGSGASVSWQAPAQATIPMSVAVRLEVVERYGPVNAPASLEHRVSATQTLSLHDSTKEVGDMARQFLLDFSDSSVRDVPFIMRNWEPGCYGTADETAQVTQNRVQFRIIASSVGQAAVTVNFGGVCPFRTKPGDACAQVPVFWDSIDVLNGDHGPPAKGTDQVAAMYIRSRQEWRLCDSAFNGVLPLHMRNFIR
jgi:hypothetical protein